MTALKIIRYAAWTAVAAVVGAMAAMALFGLPGQIASSTVQYTGTATVGGPFELSTTDGKPFTHANVEGKPYLVFFGFTNCPDVCPTTLFELTALFKEMGPSADKITPLMVSVDPERDIPEMLKVYMTAFDPRIIALRGTPEQTAKTAKAFAAYFKKVPLEGGNYTMDHTAGVWLMKADGTFQGTLDMHEPRETQLKKLAMLAATMDWTTMTFAVFAAIACAWSYVIAFLVLTAMTSRRNGQSVWLFGKGRERQALPALLFRAAFVLAVTYPPLSIWLPARTETLVGAGAHSGVLHAVEMIGLATMAIGAMFALYSQNHIGASWRIGAASGHLGDIVDTGPFRISRNPVFVGQCVLFIGLLIVFPTVIQFLITIGLLVAVRLQVGIEERVLVGEMGEDYQAYKRRVRRWL